MAMVESQVAGTELEKVIPTLQTLFESEDTFFSSIQKQNVEVISSRQMRVPLAIRPGGNFGYFNPNGFDLGRGGGPTFDKAVLNSVFMSENIEYTKLVQWSTDDRRKAIIDGVRKITAGAFDELRRQLDAQMQQPGTGVVGTIATPSNSGAIDTYVLDPEFGARLVRFGQTIQVFDTTLATNKGSAEIIFYDAENSTIKVTPAVAGVTAGDVLVVRGIDAPASVPGLFGVPYHDSSASTGVWLGFNRANYPEVRASRVNAASAPLTLPLPRLAINKIGNRVGMDNKFSPVAWMHPCQVQAYEEIGQLVSIIQKMPKDESLNMYFGGSMQMAGANVRATFNWSKKRIDFVSKSIWGRAEIKPLGFYTSDGRNIFEIRGASGGVATADIFYLTIGTQTFVNNPAACAYIDGLAIPSGYA